MKPLTARLMCRAWLDMVEHHQLNRLDTIVPNIRHITFFLMRLQYLHENASTAVEEELAKRGSDITGVVIRSLEREATRRSWIGGFNDVGALTVNHKDYAKAHDLRRRALMHAIDALRRGAIF